MPHTRTANAVRLEFTPGSLVQRNLLGAAFSGKATLDRNRRLLTDDPHFGPFMNIPGKDNGLDIEGLAVDGSRRLISLREPVRFEAALTQSVSLPHGRGTKRAEAICCGMSEALPCCRTAGAAPMWPSICRSVLLTSTVTESGWPRRATKTPERAGRRRATASPPAVQPMRLHR